MAANAAPSSNCRRWLLPALLLGLALCNGCAVTGGSPGASAADLRDQVAATERAFARTMAERDLAGFEHFIADEAVFFAGARPLRGKAAVVEVWRKFFEGPQAPFSWEPNEVEVLASGKLALSSGPVRDGAGKLIATFTSIWRLEAPGRWRIVFDKGTDACRCPPAAAADGGQ